MSDTHAHARPRRRRPTVEPLVMASPTAGVVGVPVRGGGLTPEVMVVAALLVLPAVWRSLVEGDLPLYLAMERYLVLTAGCALASWLFHGWSESTRAVEERVERVQQTAYAAEPAAPFDDPFDDPFDVSLDAPFDAPPDHTGGLLELEPGAYDAPLLDSFDAPAPLESLDAVVLPPEEEPFIGMETVEANDETRSFSLFD